MKEKFIYIEQNLDECYQTLLKSIIEIFHTYLTTRVITGSFKILDDKKLKTKIKTKKAEKK